MNKLLKTCKIYSGIREQITDAEEAIIIDLITTEYKSLTEQDVAIAFKLNATGKYWKPVEGYQNFSAIFVGKVLSHYKEWKRKQNTIKKIEPLKELPEPKSDPKRAFDFIVKVWNEEGKLPFVANWKRAFDYAEKEGMIRLSKKEKWELFEKKKKEVKNKINDARNKMQNYRKLELELQPLSIKTECKKEAILNYLKQKVD